MKYIFLSCLFVTACDQVDLYFFKVGEKEKKCDRHAFTLGSNTGDSTAVQDSTYGCGTDGVEVKPK